MCQIERVFNWSTGSDVGIGSALSIPSIASGSKYLYKLAVFLTLLLLLLVIERSEGNRVPGIMDTNEQEQ